MKTKTVVKETRGRKPNKSEDDSAVKVVSLWTPAGRFSFPNLAYPDERPEYGDGAYSCDLLITKATFKEKGEDLKEAVLTVGRDAFGSKFDIKPGSLKPRSPFKDTDKNEKIEDDRQKGCILLRAKASPNKRTGSARQPLVIGPRKDPETGRFIPFTQEEIEAIKGGDWGFLQIGVFAYEQQGGGVTFGLNAVQFWKEGEAFGQGRSAILDTAEEHEVELDEPEDEEEPRKKTKSKKVDLDEDEEEDETPSKRKNKKDVEEEDEENDDFEEESPEEDEEEEKPVKKGKKSRKDEDDDDVF